MSITTALPQSGAVGDPSPLSADVDSADVDRADVLCLLDEFWCSDCQAPALFERMNAGTTGSSAAGSEWACMACGAAYCDAIDLLAG
jgi:hypothetical protein